MASTSETGHKKNLANIDKVIDLVTQFGATYNPSNPLITVAGLNTLKSQCTLTENNADTTYITFKNDTNAREVAFDPVAKTASAINDHVKTLSISQQTIDDVTALTKVIRGDYTGKLTKADAGKLNSENSTNTSEEETTETNTVSTSRQSYDNILANLNKLVQLVASNTSYVPNESKIQVVTLNALVITLTAKNLAAVTATNAYFLARNQRNLTFYAPQTGLCDIMKKAKLYVKQVYGTNSAEYKQITTIKFTKYSLVKKSKKKTS